MSLLCFQTHINRRENYLSQNVELPLKKIAYPLSQFEQWNLCPFVPLLYNMCLKRENRSEAIKMLSQVWTDKKKKSATIDVNSDIQET